MEKDSRYYVAITGASGSGKTTILRILEKNGYFTKDYDLFSIGIVKKSQIVHSYLRKIMGDKYLTDRPIDLKQVGLYFEQHLEQEMAFERWYQPYLGEQIKKDILLSNYKGLCFFDVPFLKEKNISELFDEVWVVSTEKKLCIERVQARNGYDYDKADYLVERSIAIDENMDLKKIIIDNNRVSLEQLEKKVIIRLCEIKYLLDIE